MKRIKYKGIGNSSLFDNEERTGRLSKLGNPLEKLSKVVDFEMFRDDLEDILLNKDKDYRKGGARPYDVVMMFKLLIIQQYYNLSDDQMEYQLTDRLSFRNFLGLDSGDKIPDAKTIWLYNDRMSKAGGAKRMFDKFTKYLNDKGFYLNAGQMMDASFVEVPRQRNTREENKMIKEGKGDELWLDNPHKKCQKDTDARWTKKNNQVYYGYKDHIKDDTGTKLINNYTITSASVHDSQEKEKLLDERDSGQDLFADSAYVGETIAMSLEEKGIENQINKKAYKGTPLTKEEQYENRLKSKIRARVEHIFGFMEMSLHKMFARRIGLVRNSNVIGMMNLIYNMFRYEQILRYARK